MRPDLQNLRELCGPLALILGCGSHCGCAQQLEGASLRAPPASSRPSAAAASSMLAEGSSAGGQVVAAGFRVALELRADPVLDAEAIFVDQPATKFPRRAALARVGPLRFERDGPLAWSPESSSPQRLFEPREEVVLERGPAALRLLLEEGGLRLAVYMDPADFELRPTRAVELLATDGARYLDGFVLLQPGADVEATEAAVPDYFRITVGHRSQEEASFSGAIPASALGLVYTPVEVEVARPDLWIKETRYLLDAPNGQVMLTFVASGDKPVGLVSRGPLQGEHRLVRYQGERWIAEGWLSPPPSVGTIGYGTGGQAYGAKRSSHRELPAGTRLWATSTGPQIGITLTSVVPIGYEERSGNRQLVTVDFPSWGPIAVWIDV